MEKDPYAILKRGDDTNESAVTYTNFSSSIASHTSNNSTNSGKRKDHISNRLSSPLSSLIHYDNNNDDNNATSFRKSRTNSINNINPEEINMTLNIKSMSLKPINTTTNTNTNTTTNKLSEKDKKSYSFSPLNEKSNSMELKPLLTEKSTELEPIQENSIFKEETLGFY